MKRYGWWIGVLCACGDVQEKSDPFDNDVWDQSNPSSQTEEPTQEESAELDEDYCDYVYLLERRLSVVVERAASKANHGARRLELPRKGLL